MASEREYIIRAIYETQGWESYQTKINQSGRVVQRFTKTFTDESGRTIKATKDIADGNKLMGASAQYAGNQMGDLERALRRAAIVAPVWLAVRAIMTGVIQIIRDGAKAWEEWDRQLIKTKATIIADDIEVAFSRLKKTTEELSIATGTSLEKLTSVFYRFSTLGNPFEVAIAGEKEMINLAMVTGGDADDLARAFAFAFKLLGDSLDKSLTPAENMNDIAAKTAKIWSFNAFEANEFAKSLEYFVSTANTANISMYDMLSILTALSSAGFMGGRGGQNLRTTITKLTVDIGDLNALLGTNFNPNIQNTADILYEVIGRLQQMIKEGNISRATNIIQQVFGGTRGGEPLKALAAVRDLLEKNRQIYRATGEEQIQINVDYAKRIEEVTASYSKQSDISRTLRTEIGRSFLAGVVGAQNYESALKNINTAMEFLLVLQNKFVELQSSKFAATFRNPIAQLMYAISLMQAYYTVIQTRNGNINPQDIQNVLNNWESFQTQQLFGKRMFTEDLKTQLEQARDEFYKEQATHKEPLKVPVAFVDIKTGEEFSSVEEAFGKPQFTGISLDSPSQQIALKGLVKYELDKLKIAGATEVQLTQANALLMKTLGIDQKQTDIWEQKLAIQQAINNEKMKELHLSNQTMAIFKVAQEYGVVTANRLAEFLTKPTLETYDILKRFPEALSALKKFFPNISEQIPAAEFFFRGRGQNIEIPERTLSRQIIDLQTQLQQQVIVDFNINIEGEESLGESAMRAVQNELSKKGSIFASFIDAKIKAAINRF